MFSVRVLISSLFVFNASTDNILLKIFTVPNYQFH
jgi:hypothetical protein